MSTHGVLNRNMALVGSELDDDKDEEYQSRVAHTGRRDEMLTRGHRVTSSLDEEAGAAAQWPIHGR